MFDLADGKQLIELAKFSINSYLFKTNINIDEDIRKRFSEKYGVFVTLNKDDQLRGCIGYPEPVFPLYKAIIDAARAGSWACITTANPTLSLNSSLLSPGLGCASYNSARLVTRSGFIGRTIFCRFTKNQPNSQILIPGSKESAIAGVSSA